jgi:hypothetical protein
MKSEMSFEVLSIACVSEYDCEYPSNAVVFFGEQTRDKLVGAQDILSTEGALSIRYLTNALPDFRVFFMDEEGLELFKDAQNSPDVGISDMMGVAKGCSDAYLKGAGVSMDCPALVVKNDSFRLSATPKHCGDMYACYSDDFVIKPEKEIS